MQYRYKDQILLSNSSIISLECPLEFFFLPFFFSFFLFSNSITAFDLIRQFGQIWLKNGTWCRLSGRRKWQIAPVFGPKEVSVPLKPFDSIV